MVRAVVDNNAIAYIRTVEISDPARSVQYKEDAILTNFTRLTRDGLKGLVFRKPSVVELPGEMEYLRYDATGENLNFNQLLAKSIDEVLETGRYGLLADYPKAEPDLSGIDKEQLGYYARIKPYRAEHIINHKRKYVGSKYVLSLVTLCEFVDCAEDPFSWKQETQYRVLMLDENNEYCQIVYKQEPKDLEPTVVDELFYPVDYSGNRLNEIPFVFIGAENNDPDYDSIPLYDLSVLNIGHYRNSADYEESVYITGQPYPVVCVGDNSPEQFQAANPNGVKFGSRAGLVVGAGGSAQLLQANANQLADAAMARKEIQAAAIGARLIAPPGGRETAEGARIRYGAQNSALYIITENVSKGLESVTQWCCIFMGANPLQVTIQLNKQFYDETADPNLLVQQIQLFDRGIIAGTDIRAYGRKTGFIDDNRTDAQIEAEAEIVDPMAGADNVIA